MYKFHITLENSRLDTKRNFYIPVKETQNMPREQWDPKFSRKGVLSCIKAGLNVSQEELENYLKNYIKKEYPYPWFLKTMEIKL